MAKTPATTTVVEEPRRENPGWYAFWGVIGGAIIAAVVVGGYMAFNYSSPQSPLNVVHAQVAQFEQQLEQKFANLQSRVPQVRPNGSDVKYGVGTDGQPNRTVADTAGIYDELHGDIASLTNVVKAQSDSFAAELKAQSAAQKASIDGLTDKIQVVVTEVKSQGTRLDDVVDRVAKLEKAQVTPAPAPAASPVPAAPSVAPSAPQQPAEQPAPQPSAPQVAPAPAQGPQASVEPPVQVAQGGRIVTPDTADKRELTEMYATAKALGRPANGKVQGFAELHKGETFSCPNGNPHPVHIGHVHTEHGWADRWDCKVGR